MIKNNILIKKFKKKLYGYPANWDPKTLKNASRDYLEKD